MLKIKTPKITGFKKMMDDIIDDDHSSPLYPKFTFQRFVQFNGHMYKIYVHLCSGTPLGCNLNQSIFTLDKENQWRYVIDNKGLGIKENINEFSDYDDKISYCNRFLKKCYEYIKIMHSNNIE